jgi:hypothetical protein
MHYGIPGQVHGVRRFQYENGKLTPEGKERYRKDSKNSEGFVDAEAGQARRNATKQEQTSKRENKSGVWKQNSISSRILDENSRKTHINQGDFSPWYGGSYQEIREDLSQEELTKILLNALDNDILSKNSPGNAYWEYQLGDDLKFHITDAEKRTRENPDLFGEPHNMERQVWNDMIDEITTNPKYEKQLMQLRSEIAARKLETYMKLENNTPHVPNANGGAESGKASKLSEKDVEALEYLDMGRWKTLPRGASEVAHDFKWMYEDMKKHGKK